MEEDFEFKINKIEKEIKRGRVKIISLRFIDLKGVHRGVCYPASKIDDIFKGKVDFDGSSVSGFCPIEKGSLSLLADLSTLRIDKYSGEVKTAFMIADVITSDGELYEKAPRTILKKVLKKIEDEHGYEPIFGVEFEFYVLKKDGDKFLLTDTDDYCRYDGSTTILHEIMKEASKIGVDLETCIHEHGPSMFELHTAPMSALEMADKTMMLKDLIRKVCEKHELLACFMPKPFTGLPGNGFHIHFSLRDKKTKKSLFWGGKGKLSELGEHFMAGVMEHTKGLLAVAAPSVNSYKRLVPRFEAPTTISWGFDNRSTAFRVSPFTSQDGAKIEFRSPDMLSDPYLLFATVIETGMNGIKKELKLPEPVNGDVYRMSKEELRKKSIEHLPEDLKSAIKELKKDRIIIETLGKEATEEYIRIMEKEWKRVMTTVWPIERTWYFHENVFINVFIQEEIDRNDWRDSRSNKLNSR